MAHMRETLCYTSGVTMDNDIRIGEFFKSVRKIISIREIKNGPASQKFLEFFGLRHSLDWPFGTPWFHVGQARGVSGELSFRRLRHRLRDLTFRNPHGFLCITSFGRRIQYNNMSLGS
jgi:hypothetical protein